MPLSLLLRKITEKQLMMARFRFYNGWLMSGTFCSICALASAPGYF